MKILPTIYQDKKKGSGGNEQVPSSTIRKGKFCDKLSYSNIIFGRTN